MFSTPDGLYRHTFSIGLASEEYFELIDFILEFTGIKREMLDVEIMAPATFGPGFNTVIDQPAELEPEVEMGTRVIGDSMTLFMGTRLLRRSPGSSTFF